MTKKKVAIITVNFENYTPTREFIDSFQGQTNPNYKLFIADLSIKRKQIKSSDKVEVFYAKNNGFAYGFDVGLKKAINQDFDFFASIGNDTVVDKYFVDSLIKSGERHPGAIVGAKIYYEKGFEYHKDKYKKEDLGNVIWFAGGQMDWDNVYSEHIGVDEVDRGQYNSEKKVDFITGCLMLFDKSVVDTIGFWDSSYFLYYEDADFCARAHRAGIKLIYDPSIKLWHKNAQSSGGSGSALQRKYQEKNRLRLGLKYAPWKTKLHLLKNYFFS